MSEPSTKTMQPVIMGVLLMLCMYLALSNRNGAESFQNVLEHRNKLNEGSESSMALKAVREASKAVAEATESAAATQAAATQAGEAAMQAGEAAARASAAAEVIVGVLKDKIAQLQLSASAVQSAAIAGQPALQALPRSNRFRISQPPSDQHDGKASTLAVSAVASSTSLKRTYYDYTQVVTEVYGKQGFKVCPSLVPDTECWLQLSKSVNCTTLFTNYLTQMASHKPVSPAPKTMPPELRDLYLLHGAVKQNKWYKSDVDADNGKDVFSTWSQEYLDNMTAKAKQRPDQFGAYGQSVKSMYHALDCHSVRGLHGAVMGTRKPWLEAVLLAFGVCRMRRLY